MRTQSLDFITKFVNFPNLIKEGVVFKAKLNVRNYELAGLQVVGLYKVFVPLGVLFDQFPDFKFGIKFTMTFY